MSDKSIQVSDAVLAADTEGFAAYVGRDGREQHRAGLRAAIAAWVREQDAGPHVYLSTGCLHGDHGYCQSTHSGRKKPGICKFCPAPCVCSCHQSGADR